MHPVYRAHENFSRRWETDRAGFDSDAEESGGILWTSSQMHVFARRCKTLPQFRFVAGRYIHLDASSFKA
jgi:hypothetical protein